MKKTNNRLARLETDIKKILAEVITYEIKDPRISTFVAVTRVELTRDFSYATVYISSPTGSCGSEIKKAEADELLEGLHSAKGFLKKKLAAELTIHRTPDLIFKYDDTADYLRHIDDLLAGISKKGVNTHTIPQIAGILKSDTYQSIGIFPHIFADGDAIGSAVAVYYALLQLGKQPELVMTEPVAKNLSFLTENVEISSDLEKVYDMVVSVDTSSKDQFRDRIEVFENAGVTMSIDHHKTNPGFADFVYVDSKAAAAGEILYFVMLELGVELTVEIGEALYTAISTDTGSFKHPNATANTFYVASKLMETGFDFHKVSTALYKNMSKNKVDFLQTALNNLEIVDDKLSISHIIDKNAEDPSDYDGITDYLLSIEGIEVAAFCRRLDEDRIKFSLRSKNDVDVSVMATEFGGGGHMRASGFTTEDSFDEVKSKIIEMFRNEIDGK